MIFGLIGVVGIKYNLNHYCLGIEYKYDYSFNELVNFESEWGVTNNITYNYSSLILTLGYKFSK